MRRTFFNKFFSTYIRGFAVLAFHRRIIAASTEVTVWEYVLFNYVHTNMGLDIGDKRIVGHLVLWDIMYIWSFSVVK